MYLKQLFLKNFRNYEDEEITFHEKLNVFLGNNGQGKSNLLEGIYILSMGKSFRTTKDFEMIRFEAEFLRSKGLFIKDERELSVEAVLKKEEKYFKVNGVKGTKNACLLENAYIVIFSPEDILVVKGEPERRRRFLDREIFQIRPLYYKDLMKYKKSLQQRNVILKEEYPDEKMLDVWDENLLLYGMKVMKERKDFVEKLRSASCKIHANITGGKEVLDVKYDPNIEMTDSLEEQRNVFLKRLAECRARDMDRGYTGIGPHKDDLRISIGDIDVRDFGSQGQKRTAALSLKLAELQIIKEETGEDAVVLLDDVLSELDRERQRFLIQTFEKNQIFISAAEMSAETGESLPEGKIFHIESGRVRA
jgi:DNA replication and repair protein RecF